jgi:hypothetical protein
VYPVLALVVEKAQRDCVCVCRTLGLAHASALVVNHCRGVLMPQAAANSAAQVSNPAQVLFFFPGHFLNVRVDGYMSGRNSWSDTPVSCAIFGQCFDGTTPLTFHAETEVWPTPSTAARYFALLKCFMAFSRPMFVLTNTPFLDLHQVKHV